MSHPFQKLREPKEEVEADSREPGPPIIRAPEAKRITAREVSKSVRHSYLRLAADRQEAEMR
jgi:hypothetical protein